MNFMKDFRIFSCLLIWICACTLYAKDLPREELLINSCWKYSKGDHEHAEQEDFDDTSWENVGLPHSVSLILCRKTFMLAMDGIGNRSS